MTLGVCVVDVRDTGDAPLIDDFLCPRARLLDGDGVRHGEVLDECLVTENLIDQSALACACVRALIAKRCIFFFFYFFFYI